MKKLFGGINLTWTKIILFAILTGVYIAIISLIPNLTYTSFNTITTTFEVWILFGILIIMNSKSPKDSALKCFIFFLISQPLVYLVQDVITGSHLFITYYRFWILWTIACIPMGYIGYYMKKDKWWGYLILFPMLLMVLESYADYLSNFIFSYPYYLLITLFCALTMIIYPIYIFNNKKIRIVGTVISTLAIIVMTIVVFMNRPTYETVILCSGEEYTITEDTNAYLEDDKYGTLNIKYDEGFESYCVYSRFIKAGKTKMIIETNDGSKRIFNIDIKRSTYELDEVKND